jgi:UDP-N-acetylmuramyl pentapeptide phosphotransferase/UDP-N-acetylglucosamine-1-phosphate transferase
MEGWGAAGAAFVISLAANLLVIRLSARARLFLDDHRSDKPQRFHEDPTPRAGGIGILAGLLPLLGIPGGWKLLLPGLLAFFSGILEDFHQSLSPKKRLLLQLFAASIAILLTGAVVRYLGFGIYLPGWLALCFSVFAIVGAMNAINIIDGFNGLAGGIVLLILLSFGITAHRLELEEVTGLIEVIAGAVGGFYLLNFPRGRIFLGDGGAYLLGFLVAVLGIFLAGTQEKVSPWYILAVLIYPVWEVLFSAYRKRREGRSPLEPDAYHLHMLVYRHLTRNNPLTSVAILGATLPFFIAATLSPNDSKFNFLLVLIFIGGYLLSYRWLRRREEEKISGK